MSLFSTRFSVALRGLAVLGILSGGVGAASLAATSPAEAQTARIGRIVVDTSALRASGVGGNTLAVLDNSLRRNLNAQFGGEMGRGGATLIVRINGLSMNDDNGPSRFSGWGGDGSNDYMQGTVTMTGPGNQVLSSFPLMNTLPASSGGAWYDPGSGLRRIDALSANYAQWIGRKLS